METNLVANDPLFAGVGEDITEDRNGMRIAHLAKTIGDFMFQKSRAVLAQTFFLYVLF